MGELERLAASLSGLDVLVIMKIDHSVGKGGSNRPHDVQKVQFILNVVHLDAGNFFRMPSLLSMDGICGPMTLNAILRYQNYKQNSGSLLLAADGLVTATHHAVLTNAHSLGFSTLYHLNMDFIQALPRTDMRLLVGGYLLEPLLSQVILPLRKAGVLPTG